MITVVGMGRKVGDLTAEGLDAIAAADVVVVKSCKTHAAQAVQKIRDDALYCDEFFQNAEDFDALNRDIAQFLKSFGNKSVAFCVVGDGTDDTTVPLLGRAKKVYGVSLHTPVAPLQAGYRVFTAQELCEEKHLLAQPLVVKCIDDKYVAAEVQLKLLQAFDGDTPVEVVCGNAKKTVELCQLCKQKFDYQTTIGICPLPLTRRHTFGYYDAAEVLSILRSPNGCPWDREQTHQSITKNAVEEAYELVDALEREEYDHVVEELGDLLMQVLFHLEIASDNGEFEPTDVYSGLCRKLIDRHPHVFGDVHAENSQQSLDVWEQQKRKEHKIKTVAQNVLDVPFGMSALLRCQKVQSRAAKGGYDFPDVQEAAKKVQEELQEFLAASPQNLQMEGGDLLFAAVNVLRLLGADSETALLASTRKFCNRVVECERLLQQRGQKLCDLTQQQFDDVWEEAKGNVG